MALLVLHLKGAIVSTVQYELPIMLLVSFTFPALVWFAQLFSHLSSSRHTFVWIYFISHLIVELYAFIVPIAMLNGYWNDSTAIVKMHPILYNTGKQYGKITVRQYLILNSVIVSMCMLTTVYITCCLHSYAKFKDYVSNISAEAR